MCDDAVPPSVTGRMPPSQENDAPPKAPDKKGKEEKTLSDLNDGELRGLLDEALNYKNPKDREGKSKLFNHLLIAAEEDERNARASRAGGSELVRYCNPSAKRSSRHRKKRSSVSENLMHGGSLDNLNKEDIFETSKHRTKKSVSARQREGGSLPCNVNASTHISHDYQFIEEARRIKEMGEKIKTDLVEEQRLLEHDTLDQNFQEKNEIKYTTRASLQVNEVDGPIQFTYLEQGGDRKNCIAKSNGPIIGGDCSGSLRISNDSKKVDENGNAVHQTLVKTKKKKVLSDKNVVVCNAENVEGHRSDIISDIDKLMEFIGISDDQAEKNRPLKSKLNRHSSDDSKSSKKRGGAHSSKTKDNRGKLKKSNSLGEISTSTNLEDFDFEKEKVVLRISDKPRERRSWGTMDPLPLQNLYNNVSVENLETAEFRVVTKKKKSKKRRNSISGRTTKNSPNSSSDKGSNDTVEPDLRRKSACSVPHSEKSNDSSDADSVHSLPIDPQRLDLMGGRRPVSYADMAKISDNSTKGAVLKEKKEPVKVCEVRCETVKTPPPDVHNFKNFPAIITKVGKFGGVKKTVGKSGGRVKLATCAGEGDGGADEHVLLPSPIHLHHHNNEDGELRYSSALPPDIPDVQTIEKLQLMNCYHDNTLNNNSSPTDNYVNHNSDVASPPSKQQQHVENNNNNNNRPAVVILSGNGGGKEVPGLVFGFDINEQLLNEDVDGAGGGGGCEDFISRYMAPDVYTATSHNHDKIVSYIGAAWEEAIVNVSSGKVQYYTDLL